MMTKGVKVFVYSVVFAVAIMLSGCAQINPLQGGQKDSFAPRIDSVGTYPVNGQTNFTGQIVELKFSEYIALNNPTENILITPQLITKPTYRVKNKKLIIAFVDTLSANTTYTISFNHAITDITEKNDSVFQFVFSTGDYIDSLTLSGVVRDAFTNKPAENYLIGLYATSTNTPLDSVPFVDMPVYIAQTNTAGLFKLNYLKGGEYLVYAIKDGNRNLKLDPSEDRAFMPSGPIVINDSTANVELLAFHENSNEVKIIRSKFEYPGKLTFIFSQPTDSFSVKSSMNLIQESTNVNDSLVFWLEQNPTPKMEFITILNGISDTIKPLYKGVPTLKVTPKLNFTTNLVTGKLLPKDSLKIGFSEPISSISTNGIHYFTKDTVELDAPLYVVQNCRSIVFTSSDVNIRFVKIDSGAVQSYFGNSNSSDEWVLIEFLDQNYFGTLQLNIDSTFNVPVLVQLLDTKNEVVAEQSFGANPLIFYDLAPGKYQVRLILDENNDGLWSTGSLKENKMPEKAIYNKELIDIKSNWEKEVDWLLK